MKPDTRTFKSLPVGAVFQPLADFKEKRHTYYVKCFLFRREQIPLHVGLQIPKNDPITGLANMEFPDSTKVIWLTGHLQLKTNGHPKKG